MANQDIVKQGVVGALLIGIFVLTFFILKPIIISIIFGLLFAYIFSPVYKKINKRIKGRGLAAFILMLGLTAIIAIPLIYIVPIIVTQTFDTYILLKGVDFTSFFSGFFEPEFARTIAINIDNFLGQIFSGLLNQFTNLLVNLPSLFLQFAVFLFTFFFAIKDSDKLSNYLCSLSPFSSETEKKLSKELRGITNAIVFGQVLIGIIQGLAVGIGLLLLGVPKAMILTFLAMIVSMVPVLGSWLVWFPVSILLMATGQTFAGIFLLIYGALFVSTIDNILRPYFLSRKSNLPIALGVIGTIGGLYFFGIAGLVLGPLIIAYVLIIIEFYRQGKLKELFNK